MKGRRPTYREIEEAVASLAGEVRGLKRAVGERDRTIEDMRKRLRYYENENSPHPRARPG